MGAGAGGGVTVGAAAAVAAPGLLSHELLVDVLLLLLLRFRPLCTDAKLFF